MKFNWKQLLAYVLVAIIAVLAVNHVVAQQTHTLYNTQLSRCQAGNVLRSQFNIRIGSANRAIGANNHILTAYLDDAGKARFENYKSTHLKSDLKASKQYYGLAKILKSEGYIPRLAPIQLTNCQATIARP